MNYLKKFLKIFSVVFSVIAGLVLSAYAISWSTIFAQSRFGNYVAGGVVVLWLSFGIAVFAVSVDWNE